MEKLADAIDSADQVVEGSSNVSSEYRLRVRGRPYNKEICTHFFSGLPAYYVSSNELHPVKG
jgi:hypothetical protein